VTKNTTVFHPVL